MFILQYYEFMILHRLAKSSRLEKLPLADLTKSETQFRGVHIVFPYRSIDPIWNLGLERDSLTRRNLNLPKEIEQFSQKGKGLLTTAQSVRQPSVDGIKPFFPPRWCKTYRKAFALSLLSTVNVFLRKRLSNISEFRASSRFQVEPPSVLPSRTLT